MKSAILTEDFVRTPGVNRRISKVKSRRKRLVKVITFHYPNSLKVVIGFEYSGEPLPERRLIQIDGIKDRRHNFDPERAV